METKELTKKKAEIVMAGIAGPTVAFAGSSRLFKDFTKFKVSEELVKLENKLHDTITKRLDLEWQIERLVRIGSKKDAENLWKLSRSRLYYLRKELKLERLITKEKERLQK